jgi:hypothetical protein
MSSYGPAGQPQPYGEPVDPFSGPTSPAGEQWSPPPVPPAAPPQFAPGAYAPGSAAPPVYQPDYGYQTEWQQPPRQRSGLVIALVSIFVVLALVGAALAVALLTTDDKNPVATPTACPAAPTADPHCFTAGKCLKDAGTGTNNVQLLQEVTPCATGSYKVVGRFDGTYDTNSCSTIAATTRTYFYNAQSGDAADLVLCLQKLP